MDLTSASPQLRFAIIGCGLIGRKRSTALPAGALRATCDVQLPRAEALLPKSEGAYATDDPTRILNDRNIDAVVISTLNDSLAPLALQALEAGKHVMVEKPGAISAAQIETLKIESRAADRLVRIGFNHRYHPAFLKARELFDAGATGPLMFIRGRYGHGGRVGYDREWRANPALSGGGELIDQGVHLIDLASWFLGDFSRVEGHAATYFWDMPVDDNAFVSLQTGTGQTAWLHVSCTEWKNLFSFEIYGRTGKLHIEGLGGSYGVERLSYYRMLPEMGPPETTIWEFPRGDDSWAREVQEFIEDIRCEREPVPGLAEACRALEVVETIYKKSGF